MAQDLIYSQRGGLRRPAGGAAALVLPTVLVVVALGVGFGQGGDMSDVASSILASLVFVLAAPTAWVFAIDFIEAERFTVVFVSILTSFPVWYLLGSAMAGLSDTWSEWLRRYLTFTTIWITGNVILIMLIAQLLG